MFAALNDQDIAPGFHDPVAEAQSTFRAVLDALSRPGTLATCGENLTPPTPLQPAAAAFLLAMADFETPVWLDAPLFDGATGPWLKFHCSTPVLPAPDEATFAVLDDVAAMPPLERFRQGSEDYPDRAATVILQVDGLTDEGGVRLRGPGIRDEARLGVAGLPDRFWHQWAANGSLFPRGVDLILVSGTRLAALPRTTKVEV